ncbi:hypothetical protein L618_002400000090 [Rhodococcus rhodochrous J45]|uniref:Uncharacterized protein n=1 Tax=Rhodococcus rhodochrous J45 TaxID=935266 RepID=A0A562E301_RHORH|nr:hypothetical protein L618_002400000090 [Rhodococcus rhodochrous J45]
MRGVVAVEVQDPLTRLRGGGGVAVEQIRQANQHVAHLLGTVHGEMGGGAAVVGFLAADDDADPFVGEGVEGILVGRIVTEVDRHECLRFGDLIEDPAQRRSLVRCTRRDHLEYSAAAQNPETILCSCDLGDGRGDVLDALGGRGAPVDGDDEAAVFDHDTRDRAQPVFEASGHLGQERNGGHRVGIVVPFAVRAGEFAAVAARIPNPRDPDPCLHVGQIASADHRDRAGRQPPQGCAGAVGKSCGVRIRHDVGQGAVEVEQDRRGAHAQQGCHLVPGGEGIGDRRQVQITRAQVDLAGIADHHGVLPTGFADAVRAGDDDHQGEPGSVRRGGDLVVGGEHDGQCR